MCDPADSSGVGPTHTNEGRGAREANAIAKATVQRASDALLAAVFRPMAHAINNPLQAALGAVELAGLDALGEQERARSLATAQSEILRTASLLNAVQAFARGVERGEAAPSHWRGTLDRCGALTRALARDGGMQLEIDPELHRSTLSLDCPPAHLDLVWVGVVEASLRLRRAVSPMRVEIGREGPRLEVRGSFAAEAGSLQLLPALLELLGSSEEGDAQDRSALTWHSEAGRWSLRGRVVEAL